MRKILFVLALAVGAVVGLPSAASADIASPTALWECASWRPSVQYDVYHAWPVAMNSYEVTYSCKAVNKKTHRYCSWLYYARYDGSSARGPYTCWVNY